MNIKIISEKTGLSDHTLRYYEKIGIIFDVHRKSNGHRDYNDSHIEWIEFVKKMKATGMPVAKIKEYAYLVEKGDTTRTKRKKILLDQKTKLLEKLSELQKNLDYIDYKINHYESLK